MLILDLEVLADESRCCLNNLDYFVLKYQQLSGDEVDLEEHLIGHSMHIPMINPDHAIEQARREWKIHLSGILLASWE